MGENDTKIKELKKEKIPTSSIVHFVIITLLLLIIESFLRVSDLINNGCVLGEECVDYIINTKVIIFSMFSTIIIFFMIFFIPLYNFTKFNLKYLLFLVIVMTTTDLIGYGLNHLFYYFLA